VETPSYRLSNQVFALDLGMVFFDSLTKPFAENMKWQKPCHGNFFPERPVPEAPKQNWWVTKFTSSVLPFMNLLFTIQVNITSPEKSNDK